MWSEDGDCSDRCSCLIVVAIVADAGMDTDSPRWRGQSEEDEQAGM